MAGAVSHYGLARLSDGRWRQRLESAVAQILDLCAPGFAFDEAAADRYGPLVAARQGAGRPISVQDAMIASIRAAVGATLATRNVADFEDTGIPLVDPWRAEVN